MKINNENGITIIALVITVIIMIILAGVGIRVGTETIEKAKLEDIKTNMLSIKTKAKTIADKKAFGDIENYEGELLEVAPSGIESSAQLYKWNESVLTNQGLGNIQTTDNKYYLVSYEPEEVYYWPGFNYKGTTYYSLTDMQNIIEE